MGPQQVLLRSSETPVPAEVRAAFVARAARISMRKGQMLIAAGLASDDVFLVLAGRVQVSLLSDQGRETIIRDIGENEIFGEIAAIDGSMRSANVTSEMEGSLAVLSGQAFRDLVTSDADVSLWLARHLTTQIRFLTSRIYELSNLNVGNRLHCELLRLAIKAGVTDDTAVIHRVPTHAELAARIGTNREAVTRELGLLTEEGFVHQTGRRMEIKSVDKLGLLIRQLPHMG